MMSLFGRQPLRLAHQYCGISIPTVSSIKRPPGTRCQLETFLLVFCTAMPSIKKFSVLFHTHSVHVICSFSARTSPQSASAAVEF